MRVHFYSDYGIHTILMATGVPGLNSNSWYGSCCLCNTEMVKQYINIQLII